MAPHSLLPANRDVESYGRVREILNEFPTKSQTEPFDFAVALRIDMIRSLTRKQGVGGHVVNRVIRYEAWLGPVFRSRLMVNQLPLRKIFRKQQLESETFKGHFLQIFYFFDRTCVAFN